MVCDTGISPTGSFVDFIHKDPIIALNRHRDREATIKNEIYVKIPVGQVPHGTTKYTYKLGLDTDAKIDREKKGIQTKVFPRNPTDNINSEAPAIERPFQKLYDQMVTQPRYEKNVMTTNPWSP